MTGKEFLWLVIAVFVGVFAYTYINNHVAKGKLA
jgi:hypothetical protein